MRSSTPWEAVLDLIQRQKLVDLLVAGYLKTDGPVPRFQPIFDRVYVQLERDLVEIESVDQGDQLRVTLADEIYQDEVMSADDGVVPGVVTLSDMYFGEYAAIRCLALTVYLDERSHNADGVVKGLELGLENGHRLSFDPLWSFGIRLSAEPYLDGLLKWHPPRDSEMPKAARWEWSAP